ncbi:type III PLP-dependent enzyme [Catenuloplanes atrovinosus]|uniref:Diaminopimelate decarboxylase n=1 Tax=Catenuloplanes atrovinosus TaxID=137266 RepID=A0AAE4CAK3_9ACTN|nr:type III PLP-dependent enzyme [Catenuloplanes atrovinosus]MDR7275909.1 diaminopimelate decarboxylase [Catenuloplanes atrovinosus]
MTPADALRHADRPVSAYVYSRAALRSAAARVRAALPPGATLLYAVKANGHPDVVATLAAATDGLEVASGGELALAIAAGATRIAFGGPAKTDQELHDGVRAGALIHVESILELRRLDAIAARLGLRATAALRVNRAVAGPDGSHRMTGTPTPFGIDEAALDEAFAVPLRAVDLRGFHLHAVSNSLDATAYAAFVAGAITWSAATAAAHGLDLRYVNVGGGLGVSYTDPSTIDLNVLRERLAAVPVPPGVDLVFEPGRLLAADAGWYAAEVVDLKRTHGRWFAVLRGGTHHFRLPAAWGYSHPFTVMPMDGDEVWPWPFDRPSVEGVSVDAVGELCTPRDVLARDVPVSRVRVGDVLVFARTGAYGWDISHHDFLRHPHPQLIVV